MKILIVSQHFWPESFRINEVAHALSEAGAEVTVLTGLPNYPEGTVFPGYGAASFGTSHERGIAIHRVPLIPRFRGRALQLIANYLSFIASAAFFGPIVLRGQAFDVVFVYGTSPILQAIPALLIGRFHRAPVVVWVQDLWPQSLEETGFVRNRPLLAAVSRVVSWIYAQADVLLAQSRAFVPSIRELSPDKTAEYFPNPSELVGARSDGERPALVLEPGFNVVFAGNLGTVQALDTVLDAAELLRGERDIRFVLIGSGSRFDWLNASVATRGLTNVVLPGRFPAAAMPGILAQASALLVSLVRGPAMSRTVPSKIQTYLAMGRPILAALDGEGAQVVLESRGGVAVPAEDPRALADAVLGLRGLGADTLQRMGEAGRRYHAEHFDSRRLAERLLERFRLLLTA